MLLRARLDPITRGWAVVTSAEVARLALGLVASLLLARALGPAQFGVYSVLAAAVGIFGALAEGGLTESAVLRMAAVWPTSPEAAHSRGRMFLWTRLGLASLVIAVACVFAVPLAMLLGLPAGDTTLLIWALLGVVATACSGAASAMLQATGAFGRMSTLTLVNTGLTAVLAVVLALLDRLNLVTALVVLGIGTSLGTFALAIRLLPRDWSLWPPASSRRELANEARQLLRTGRWLWLAGIFAMLAANLEVLVLNHWSAFAVVGTYAVALNLATKAQVVNHSLYSVLLPNVAHLQRSSDVALFVRRGLVRSALISLGLLALIPLAEPFILLVYGPEYAGSVDMFRLLMIVVIFDVMATPLLLLPMAYRRAHLLAGADALRALTVGAVAVALVPGYGAIGAIVARLASRIAGAALVLIALRRS
jgi:O-antigen/teichoic acid export membrane protein